MTTKNNLMKNIKWNDIMETLVLFAVACLTISYFGGYYLIITTIGAHSRLLDKIAFTLLLCKVIGTRYDKREFLILFALACLAILNYRASGNTDTIMNVLMIASLKNVELKKVFRVSLVALIFSVVLVGICSFLGYGGPVEITKDYGRGGVETRYCFGFIHPNQWAHAIFMIQLLAVLGFWEQMNWKVLLVFAIGNVIAYQYSISKTGFLTGIVLLVLTFLYKYGKRIMHTVLVKVSILLGIVSAWLLPIIAMNEGKAGERIISSFDRIITGRLMFAKKFYDHYGTSLLGKKIEYSLVTEIYDGLVLDSGVIRFLLESGWIIFFIMLFGICILTIYAMKVKWDGVVICVVCICLYAFSEYIAVSRIPANVVVYLLSYLIYRYKIDKNGESEHG